MLLTRTAQLFMDSLLTIVYPQACAICGSSVESHTLGVVCKSCWAHRDLFHLDETFCWKCGKVSGRFAAIEKADQVRCGRCDDQSFTAARACGLYEGALRHSVLALKQQPYLPAYLRHLLAAVARRDPLKSSTLVIPVPLHPDRERSRGFNQAAIIAREVSRSLRLPIDESSLQRIRQTEKYRAGLDQKGRLETVAKSFKVRFPGIVANENILLVDDVFTTGATASTCAQVLIDAGATKVFVLTIARSRH